MRWLIVIGIVLIITGAALVPQAKDFGDWQIVGTLLVPLGLLILIAAVIIRGDLGRVARFLWANKYRRLGVVITSVILIIVVVSVVASIQYKATFNVLHYDGSNWSKMSSGTQMGLCGVWGSSALDVFIVQAKW